ncbi:hypothetical protein ACHQM5_016345 [Ranunculus cassubicifolius]
MEESANRKLRLKAMRMEAAEAEASSNINTSAVSSHLCNPLAEPSLQESSPISARFDYYTDPVAAYAGNKRKTQKTTSSAPPGPANFNMPPSPCQQYNQNQIHPPDQGMYRSPLPYYNSAPWRSPTGMGPQFVPQQHGPPPVLNRPGGPPTYGIPPNSPMVGPNSPMVGGPNPGFGRGGSPNPNGYQFNNSPNPGFGWGGSPNPNEYQFNNSPNPGFGQGGHSPSARGNSPYQNGGRGGRGQYNNSPNFGYGRGGNPSPRAGASFNGGRSGAPLYNKGRGRGRGFHGSASALERPDLFYNRSMLEDPWRNLKPVVRKVESWLPKSIREEKAPKVVIRTGSTRSGLSFAEELAASYEEVAAYENTPEVEDDVNNV